MMSAGTLPDGNRLDDACDLPLDSRSHAYLISRHRANVVISSLHNRSDGLPSIVIAHHIWSTYAGLQKKKNDAMFAISTVRLFSALRYFNSVNVRALKKKGDEKKRGFLRRTANLFSTPYAMIAGRMPRAARVRVKNRYHCW